MPNSQGAESTNSGLMSPDRFSPLNNRSDVTVVARDGQFRVLWCNESFANAMDSTPQALRGTDLRAIFPTKFAEEREALLTPVLAESKPVTYEQVFRGKRCLTRVWPLDPNAFGSQGCFIVAEPCATPAPVETPDQMTTAMHADLAELSGLTRRELEIFRLLAEGLTGQEIAAALHRSHKTIEFHTARILHALSLRSRTELARMAGERGLLGFSREAWFRIATERADAPRASRKRHESAQVQ